MPAIDIGESLVGAYLRHIVKCEVVIYNSFFADRQGEVDVVALRQGKPREVWMCEVTTHIDGMQLGRDGKDSTERVIREKLDRLRHFAQITFPDDQHRYEWWSPRVAVGKRTDFMAATEDRWASEGHELRFVINDDYTERVRALAEHAKEHSSTTNEPAYRMLQILTHLRGEDVINLQPAQGRGKKSST
jgi:Holliday junction resolvase-like predicted endonuclease